MVVIRQIKPSFKIALPVDPEKQAKAARKKAIRAAENSIARKVVVRRRAVDFPAPTPQPTPCRLWQGPLDKAGYGRRRIKDRSGNWVPVTMHRWVLWQLMGRELRPTEVVMHLCDNRLCYRIDHLKIGTLQDNNADMFKKKRNKRPPTNVYHGSAHPMSKLSEDDVREIRRLAGTVSSYALAKQFGVGRAAIAKIISRQRWSHIE